MGFVLGFRFLCRASSAGCIVRTVFLWLIRSCSFSDLKSETRSEVELQLPLSGIQVLALQMLTSRSCGRSSGSGFRGFTADED